MSTPSITTTMRLMLSNTPSGRDYAPCGYSHSIVTEMPATLPIHDDGYADGGEPYTDDEMDLMGA